jgi:hypothetical protein
VAAETETATATNEEDGTRAHYRPLHRKSHIIECHLLHLLWGRQSCLQPPFRRLFRVIRDSSHPASGYYPAGSRVSLVSQELNIGKAIESILLISEACGGHDLANRVCLVPSLVMHGF